MNPALKPFFCYYGGKWRATPKYPPPLFRTIVEPFAGAAGYSTRYPDRRVILIEKDPIVAALWRWLISVSASEVRRIPLLAPGQTVDDLHVCEEAKSLVGFWLNKGSAQPKKRPSSRFLALTRPDSHWGEVIRERIATQVEQIRHWRVIEASYSETAPAIRATWHVDPPYQLRGIHYRCSAKAIDFAHLARWCQALRGQVMVCEQEGADWLPFEFLGTFRANNSKNGKGHTAEVLWQNSSSTEGSRIGLAIAAKARAEIDLLRDALIEAPGNQAVHGTRAERAAEECPF